MPHHSAETRSFLETRICVVEATLGQANLLLAKGLKQSTATNRNLCGVQPKLEPQHFKGQRLGNGPWLRYTVSLQSKLKKLELVSLHDFNYCNWQGAFLCFVPIAGDYRPPGQESKLLPS